MGKIDDKIDAQPGHRLLFAACHPGGANAIVPVADTFRAAGAQLLVLATEYTAAIFTAAGLSPVFVDDRDGRGVPRGVLQERLDSFRPDLVVVGSCNQDEGHPTTLDQELTAMATDRGVPVLSVSDYWLNFGCRYQDRRHPWSRHYLPTVATALDAFAAVEMVREGIPAPSVHVTGSPHLDQLLQKPQPVDEVLRGELIAKLNVAAGLQRDVERLAFYAGNAFSVERATFGYADLDNLRLVADALKSEPRWGLVVQLHPRTPLEDRRQIEDFLNGCGCRSVTVSGHDSTALALASDLTLVAFTMPGIIALLLGCPVISLQPGLKTEDFFVPTRFGLLPGCFTKSACRKALARALKDPQGATRLADLPDFAASQLGATRRVVELAQRMIEGNGLRPGWPQRP